MRIICTHCNLVLKFMEEKKWHQVESGHNDFVVEYDLGGT
jgi:hypothetical protein